MGRNKKDGVDYFPHFTDASGKKTIFILENEFGNDGYAAWFKLLEILGQQPDLAYDCTNRSAWIFLTARFRMEAAEVERLLNLLADIDTIDPELWREHRIIWSQNLADQLAAVYQKRGIATPKRPLTEDSRTENLENKEFPGQAAPEMPQSRVEKSREEESKPECRSTSAVEKAERKETAEQRRFEEFWAAYPRKVAKKAARSAWKKAKVDEALHRRILAAVERAKLSSQWQRDNGQFIPHPATWLNAGRWEDEVEVVENGGRCEHSERHAFKKPNPLSGFKTE